MEVAQCVIDVNPANSHPAGASCPHSASGGRPLQCGMLRCPDAQNVTVEKYGRTASVESVSL